MLFRYPLLRIPLAIHAIKQGQFRSVRAAAASYNIPRTTLRDRILVLASIPTPSRSRSRSPGLLGLELGPGPYKKLSGRFSDELLPSSSGGALAFGPQPRPYEAAYGLGW